MVIAEAPPTQDGSWDSVAVVSEETNTESTPQEGWTAVDRYITDLLVPEDPALQAAMEASVAAGMPPIAVTPNQGKLLELLARVQGARTILEIGTLGGYSTIWLARALPAGGRLVTLEAEAEHAEIARANIARAGLADDRRTARSDRRSTRCRSSWPRARGRST